MCSLFFGLVATVVTAGSAIAAQEAEMMAPVRQFIDGFNKADLNAMQAACLDDTSIVDDFPPHAWHGAGATSKWFNDFQAFEKNNGTSDAIVTLDKPRHTAASGDDAYVVVPTHIAYKKKGKPVKEAGIMTIALHKAEGGWKITGWAWADG